MSAFWTLKVSTKAQEDLSLLSHSHEDSAKDPSASSSLTSRPILPSENHLLKSSCDNGLSPPSVRRDLPRTRTRSVQALALDASVSFLG